VHPELQPAKLSFEIEITDNMFSTSKNEVNIIPMTFSWEMYSRKSLLKFLGRHHKD
jgi:hypothetical protein